MGFLFLTSDRLPQGPGSKAKVCSKPIILGDPSISIKNLKDKQEKEIYKKIIVPLDGSELAECVLPHVQSLVKAGEVAEVVFARVA